MKDEDKVPESVSRLIALGKELERAGYPLSIGTGPKRRINKEAVQMFIELSKKQPDEEIASESLLKMLLKKLHPSSKQPEERESVERQGRPDTETSKTSENQTKKLEKELDGAIAHLRAQNNIDSDVNDLRILEDMAKISSLASSLSAKGSKDVSKATIAISNYSVASRGAPLEIAVNRQALKTNSEPIAKAVRYHLDQPNYQVSGISGLPTTEEAKAEKARQNKKYFESLEYVTGMDKMRKERK